MWRGLAASWGWIAWFGGLLAIAGITFVLVADADAARARQERAQWWGTHTLSVLIGTERLDTALNRAVRGAHDFAFTGRPEALDTLQQGLDAYRQAAGELRRLTRDNVSQQRRLTRLDGLVGALAMPSVAESTEALNRERAGLARVDPRQADVVLASIKAEESRLLTRRDARAAESAARSLRFGQTIRWLDAAMLIILASAVAAMLRARALAERTAAMVAENDRLYRLLADHSDDMIVRVGLDGTRRYASPACLALLGYTPEELTGGAPVASIHADDRARVVEVARSLLSGIDDPICSYRQQHRDGHYVWLEAAYRLVRDAAGEPVEFIASVRDIKRRQAAELAAVEATAHLQESDRLFKMAASLARVGHWRVDLLRGEVVWSDEVYRIYGVSADHVPTLDNAIDPYHPDDRERVAGFVDRAITMGEGFEFAGTLLLADGSTKAVAVHGQAERAPDGQVVGILGVIQDVSAAVAAQQALHDREQQYRLLADNSTDVVLRTGDDGAILYISPSCVELSGRIQDELVGRPCADFIHRDDHAGVHAAHVAIITGARDAVTIQYRLRQKSGGWRWLESHMKSWHGPDGMRAGVISAIRDVEARKALEAELVAARESAEAAARTKSGFLANMSHEIRTPMNGVLGFTELVLSGDLAPEQRRHVELIADSGRSMMRLLNDILDVSKIEAGKMRVTQEPVDLRHVVRRCADLMTPTAEGKGLRLSTTVDAAIPARIVGDPLRLRQVMLNLIGNAVKFTERGLIALHIGAEDDSLRIEVSDTGIGIAPERLGGIFDQFTQADETIAGLYGGSGLGLTISGELVRLMEGVVSVKSLVGVGTTFTIRLPLRDAGSAAAPADAAAAAPLPAGEARKPRVLIAEDHDINQVMIVAMANRAGMDPTLASDGAQAIAMAEAAARSGQPFELVLMDMQMPNIDGLEATRRLRGSGHSAETLPIVALTANAYPEDVQACLAAGMQAHLAKPVRVRDLTAMIERFVRVDVPAPAEAVPISPKLLERYRTRKADLARELDGLAALGQPTDANVMAAVDLLHKLAGVAGLFGEATLGEHAKRLEDDLLACPADARAAFARQASAAFREAA